MGGGDEGREEKILQAAKTVREISLYSHIMVERMARVVLPKNKTNVFFLATLGNSCFATS